jgi:hypothetical protein
LNTHIIVDGCHGIELEPGDITRFHRKKNSRQHQAYKVSLGEHTVEMEG